ncbi:voltage-dependent anion channel-domain-containing protein [Daldinia sp. FL1419]|nr:voltage-dependent anion channel-domain-containing protein [Daldinia sp. FL1419]
MRSISTMPVRSSAYTVISLIGCARYIPRDYGFFERFPAAPDVLQILATWVGIFLWLFAFWLFALALVANLPLVFPDRRLRPRMSFTLSWWGFIFPNVGFAIATIMVGEELQSEGILWVATAMTVLLFATWLMDLVLHMKALASGQIMWPGQDEDVVKVS